MACQWRWLSTFKIVDPDVKNPATQQWERTMSVFNLLL